MTSQDFKKGPCTGHFLINPNATQRWYIEWDRCCDQTEDLSRSKECGCLDISYTGVNSTNVSPFHSETIAHVPCAGFVIRLDPYIYYKSRLYGVCNDFTERNLRTAVPSLPPGVSRIAHAYGSYYELKARDLWFAMDRAFKYHLKSSPRGPWECETRNLAWSFCTKSGTIPETGRTVQIYIESAAQRRRTLELTLGYAVSD